MKKLKDYGWLVSAIILIIAGTASALPMPLYNSLCEYDGHQTQENSPDQPQFLLDDGLDVSWVWDGGETQPSANETIIFGTDGALFGRVCPGNDGRNYIRTLETDNISASFDAFITIINFNAEDDHDIFIGVGAGEIGWEDDLCPDWGVKDVKTVWAVLENIGDPRKNVINWFIWDGDSPWQSRNVTVTMAGVYRLKMSYDAYAQTIVFMVDAYNDGTWDCQSDVVNIEGLFTEEDVSRVYAGSDDDAILIDYEVKPTDPYMAYNFDPPDGATLVLVEKILSWELVDPDTTDALFDVYLGTSRDEGNPDYYGDNKIVNMGTETNCDPDLEKETTYYWRVDVLEPNDIGTGYKVHSGIELSFTTLPLIPVVTGPPASQTVEIGGTATFTVEGLSFEEFEWYKDDTRLSDGGSISGSTTDTLTITDVQVDDEGRYYCKVKNDDGTAISDTAGLWTRRLIVHWTFDDTLESSQPLGSTWTGVCVKPGSGGGGGDTVIPATYSDDYIGTVGKSLRLGDDPNHIRITDSEEFFNFYPNGFTASAWVKPDQADAWQQFALSKNQIETGGQAVPAGWGLGLFSDNQAFANIKSSVSGFQEDYFGGSGVDDGDWHFVACQYNPDTAKYHLFLDGTQVAESKFFELPPPESEDILVIGVETALADAPFNGLVDDVRIWSYARSPLEIAQSYTEFADEDVCIDMDASWRHFDTVGERGEASFCKIDIEDFAEFVMVWMNCNLTPSCLP
jgi:hypothetical protein